MPRIYLDHAATTPPDPRVIEAMLPFFTTHWGNPSSIYLEGQEARRAVDAARKTIADLLGASPKEIVFTSGGTESDNAAIRGAAYAQRARGRGNHIVTTAIEHHAVLHTVEQLEREGFRATYLPVDRDGVVSLEALAEAVGPETVVVSVMTANNEVGTIQPVAEAARIARERNPRVVIHTDAVQAAGSLDITPAKLGVDLLSLAGHKIYGPKGIGLLYIKNRTPWQPFILGGSQEKERRAGTENVPGIVGLAVAMQLAWQDREAYNAHVARLRNRLLFELPERIPDTVITGPADPERRLPNNFSCCFRNVEGESVLLALDMADIAASSGSACTTGALEPSHVLTAMGIDRDLAHAALRLTLGRHTTDAEIDRVLEVLPGIVRKLRALAGA
ncbi:cysteine desulfurase family protein [Tepidiforma thermophila]|uniref:cysteine desulfurase n=1 Tax=Tepidiforma thermophila (strain KCTC 52669 / CGMCC 1.13589 / G233) TaxID=2761530 RepID=A0A2A9HIX1_TEPT2|nr:cysteine desulfurase family protein [Tepidiforma thermophila]PFG74985.1 cysteine desulfurase [Tepidiforma thermophila]